MRLSLPMQLGLREWAKNKNSVSINYGPLTYSLKIAERLEQKNSTETAMGDSKWQENADPVKWPSFEIYPASSWNYGLLLDKQNLPRSFEVVKKKWPADNNPWTLTGAPIEIKAKGKQINAWGIDAYGLCAVLPQSPVTTARPVENLTLVPMGSARLRISAFPVVK